jgi:hypothetical protein
MLYSSNTGMSPSAMPPKVSCRQYRAKHVHTTPASSGDPFSFLPPFLCKIPGGFKRFKNFRARGQSSEFCFHDRETLLLSRRRKEEGPKKSFPRFDFRVPKLRGMASPATIGIVEVLEPADKAYYRATLIDVDGKEYCVK